MPVNISGTNGINIAPLQRAADVTFNSVTTGVIATDIPDWVNRITVMLSYSLSGTSAALMQLGTGSTPTYATSNYFSTASNFSTAFSAVGSSVSGFRITGTSPGSGVSVDVTYIITRATATSTPKWVGILGGITGNNAQAVVGGGYASLSAPLTAVRLTTVNGTDTIFGTGALIYE